MLDFSFALEIYSSVFIERILICTKGLAPVVQKEDSAIQRINLYLVDSAIGFPNTYPLDRDLSGG